MDTKNGKTNNIYFPLCFLSYRECDTIAGEDAEYIPGLPEIAGNIINYGVIEYGKKLWRENFFISQNDESQIKSYARKNSLSSKSIQDKYIILSCLKLGIRLGNMTLAKALHEKLSLYLREYESRYGKDVKVKIHKDILFEVRDKKFDERMFRVYCAVLSVIGNKNFVRITIDTISFRMHGFKTSDIYLDNNLSYEVLTRRQTEITLAKLQERNFFRRFTYAKRVIYYSTKLSDEDLLNAIADKIANAKFRKSKSKIANEVLTLKVKERHLERLKEHETKLKNGK